MTLAELQEIKDRGTILVNCEGVITQVNDALCTLLGWPREEMIGRSLSMIIPVRMRDAHHMGFSRFLYSEKPTIMQKPLKLPTLRKDGSEFSAEHLIFAEKKDGVWVFGAILHQTA